jgi:hypothetical protein
MAIPLAAQFGSFGSTTLEDRTFSVAEVFMMATFAQNDIVFKRCIIRADSTTADPTKEAEWRAMLMKSGGEEGIKRGKIMIDVKVEFDSCTFSALKLTDFDFAKGIAFNSCKIEEYLGFKKCIIQSLGVSKTTIATGVEVEGLVNLELDRCTVGSCVLASNIVNSVSFDGSRFKNLLQVFSPFATPLNEFTLQNSTLDSGANAQFMGHIRSFTLSADTTHGTLTMSATILNMLAVERCAFKGAIMYDAFNTPERATTLRWTQFSGYKITVRDTVNGMNVREQDDYDALLKTYSFFYNVYNKNWQDESKNDCYVEMKTVQTRWLGIRHEREPSFTSWMVWKLNVFLETFCKYGTEPVMAIQYSMWILLIFGLLYFVFPSQPDDLTAVRFTQTFYNLASHQEERQRQARLIENDMEALQRSHEDAPPLVRVIGAPFYYGHILQYQLRLWAVRRTGYVQTLQARWQDSALASQRVGLAARATVYFSGLLAVSAAIRALNAGALSLNAFVTLGYGEIQAKGIARYLAVLEGALGWFLLSIFSVSLISQILQ